MSYPSKLIPGYFDQACLRAREKIYTGYDKLDKNLINGNDQRSKGEKILRVGTSKLLGYSVCLTDRLVSYIEAPIRLIEDIALTAINLVGATFSQTCRKNLKYCSICLLRDFLASFKALGLVFVAMKSPIWLVTFAVAEIANQIIGGVKAEERVNLSRMKYYHTEVIRNYGYDEINNLQNSILGVEKLPSWMRFFYRFTSSLGKIKNEKWPPEKFVDLFKRLLEIRNKESGFELKDKFLAATTFTLYGPSSEKMVGKFSDYVSLTGDESGVCVQIPFQSNDGPEEKKYMNHLYHCMALATEKMLKSPTRWAKYLDGEKDFEKGKVILNTLSDIQPMANIAQVMELEGTIIYPKDDKRKSELNEAKDEWEKLSFDEKEKMIEWLITNGNSSNLEGKDSLFKSISKLAMVFQQGKFSNMTTGDFTFERNEVRTFLNKPVAKSFYHSSLSVIFKAMQRVIVEHELNESVV